MTKEQAEVLRSMLAEFDASNAPKLPDLPSQEPGFGPWVRWSGGENPVGKQLCKAFYKNRQTSATVMPGNDFRWTYDTNCGDIIAYCVKLPERVKRWRWMYLNTHGELRVTAPLRYAEEINMCESFTLGPRLDWTMQESDE